MFSMWANERWTPWATLVATAAMVVLAAGAVGCRCDTPPPPAPDAGMPAPPPPPEVRDAGADVPDASDAGGTGTRRPKKAAAPPADGGGGGFKVEGALAKADAEKVVRAGYAKLRACNPEHKGKVTFRLTVDARGRVTLGEVVKSSLGGDDVEMCMIRSTRDLKFPASGGESTVDFGMSFGK